MPKVKHLRETSALQLYFTIIDSYRYPQRQLLLGLGPILENDEPGVLMRFPALIRMQPLHSNTLDYLALLSLSNRKKKEKEEKVGLPPIACGGIHPNIFINRSSQYTIV